MSDDCSECSPESGVGLPNLRGRKIKYLLLSDQ